MMLTYQVGTEKRNPSWRYFWRALKKRNPIGVQGCLLLVCVYSLHFASRYLWNFNVTLIEISTNFQSTFGLDLFSLLCRRSQEKSQLKNDVPKSWVTDLSNRLVTVDFGVYTGQNIIFSGYNRISDSWNWILGPMTGRVYSIFGKFRGFRVQVKTETGLKTETRHHFFVQHSEYGRPVYRNRFFGPLYRTLYFILK